MNTTKQKKNFWPILKIVNFFRNVFFLLEIGNNPMRELGKKHVVLALSHLKQINIDKT